MRFIFFSILLITYSNFSFANVTGADHQNFNPTTNGIDFVTVQSGQTLDRGVVNFGLFFNYAANTLAFIEEINAKKNQHTRLNDKLTSADLNVGLGLSRHWDIGFSAPILIDQDIDNKANVAFFDKTGSTEYRFNTKYRFLKTSDSYWATVLSLNKNNIDNNPYSGTDSGLVFNWELAVSKKRGLWWYGANVGHRWRDQGRSLASVFSFDPIPNQYIASLAASRHFASKNLKWITELYGSTPSESTGDNLSNRDYTNLELLSGVKWDATTHLAAHAGLATEVVEGFGSPDYRIYAGLNYTIGPIWGKSKPEEVAAEVVKEQRSFVLTNLKFKFDSDELEEASVQQVDEVIAIIRDIKDFDRLTIAGHTDSMGDDRYNMQLSQKRADAIKRLLAAAFPTEVKKIEAQGYGETEPLADNSNYQGRAQNRRVVITLYGKNLNRQLSR